ncbi:phage virion morphogenesis protein [Flammeovirga aprica]|uniref:Phage virion morphogenesis protein n=1 Tax=Flammeovirga aprica JL-4 TaxID=694437 RepID=A0A7X9RUL4_9BACT|nr:phage virion morphogenesis protein [Flammeovirga aprica]NME69018.1 hypothetical protein [Flammeovirga aprica JL-4]
MKEKIHDKLQRVQREIKELQEDLPQIMGVVAVEKFKLNFEKEGLIKGGRISKWKPRKEKRNDRKILSDTNQLENAIRFRIVSKSEVAVGVDLNKVPYAQIHNEGGTIKTKHASIDMPARPFMEITPDIDKSIERVINSFMDDIFNS